MKLLTVVGARPQFIKAAAGSFVFRQYFDEVLVHTGQHFDADMSETFFKELDIPTPKYNLGISGGTHGEMTGRMLIALEGVLKTEKPEAVLVYGDTNSTLAAALASVKLGIPLIHVEAGNRLGTLDNPEEVNRICTDHCSSLLFCATEQALENLKKEGLGEKAQVSGNIMYDAFLRYSGKAPSENSFLSLDGKPVHIPEHYYYMTCHRQENTGDDNSLFQILSAMESLSLPTVYPVHPRCLERAERICKSENFKNIMLIRPVGYCASVWLTKNAEKIVTDSGGLQCEAFYAGVQCVFVFDRPVWPETMVNGRNRLSRPEKNQLFSCLAEGQKIDSDYQPFGDGHAAEKIARGILEWSDKRR